MKKDLSVSTDASGLLKLGTKNPDPVCEANTELKLRAAWQRRSLAMDLAGLATFNSIEVWAQTLFTHLVREQPKGFSKISLQQILDCDRHLFTQISHQTMGKLTSGPNPTDPKPFDAALDRLKGSSEALSFLAPLPALKVHDPPAAVGQRPPKAPKNDAKGSGKNAKQGSYKASGSSSVQLPEGCVAHDDQGRPLCFGFQTGKCKFKGPPGKRCAAEYQGQVLALLLAQPC